MTIKIDWVKLLEAVKEPLRWVAIAIIAYVIDAIVPQMKPEYIPYVMIALRFVDKWLHDIGKVTENEVLTGGLVRF